MFEHAPGGRGDGRAADVVEGAKRAGRRCPGHVRVVEHDHGRLAAELERDRLQVLARQRHDPAARRRRPVKLTLRTAGARISASVIRGASSHECPSRLTVPAGNPAVRNSSATKKCVRGDSSDDLNTTMLPAASGKTIARTARMTSAFLRLAVSRGANTQRADGAPNMA